MNIFMILFIILIGLMIGMYLSYAFNMNEQLAIKKKYLRERTIQKLPKRNKQKLAYTFTVAMLCLFAGLSFNGFQENIPFESIQSEYHLTNIFENTENVIDEASMFSAIGAINAVEMEPQRKNMTIESEQDLYILGKSNVTRIDKRKLNGPLDTEAIVAQHIFTDIPGFTYQLSEIFQSDSHIVVIAKTLSQNWTSSLQSESIVFVLDRIELKLLKSFHLNEDVQRVNIIGERLILITKKDRSFIQDAKLQIPAINYTGIAKDWISTKFENIVFMPNENFNKILGIYSIDLEDYKVNLKSYLLIDYILDFYSNNILVAFNTTYYKEYKKKNDVQSIVTLINPTSLKESENAFLIGRVYDNVLYDADNQIVLSTLLEKDSFNHYSIYTLNAKLAPVNEQTIELAEDEILKNTIDFAYIISKTDDSIHIRSLESSWLYDITPATYDIRDLTYFSRMLKDTVLVMERNQNHIIVKQMNYNNEEIDSFEIALSTFDRVTSFIFEDYTDGKQVLSFLKVVIERNENIQSYDYYMVPITDNVIDHQNKIIIPSSISLSEMDYSFTDDLVIVFTVNQINLYDKNTMKLVFSIITG